MREKRNNTTRSSRHGPGFRASSRGFTLVEILIVVVILGILASIVIPQFSNASNLSRENMLKDECRYLRTQFTVYKAQHRDIGPGFTPGTNGAGWSNANFETQLTTCTDIDGNSNGTTTLDSTYKYGPYVSSFPPNPLNNNSTVKTMSGAASPDGTSGWLYNPDTLELVPNLTGNDSSGVPFIQY